MNYINAKSNTYPFVEVNYVYTGRYCTTSEIITGLALCRFLPVTTDVELFIVLYYVMQMLLQSVSSNIHAGQNG